MATFTPDIPFIQRVSPSWGAPTLTSGRPVDWQPTGTVYEEWGVLQLVVDGKDLSRPRAKLFLPLTDSHHEPFGDADASFAFPGLTEFDDPEAFGLTRFAYVKLRRRRSDGTYDVLYEGFIASIEPDQGNGPEIHCLGPLYRADLLVEPPALYVEEKDCGDLIASALNEKRRAYSLHLAETAHHNTGINGTSNTQFTPLVTGAIQNWLSTMTTDDGSQWTLTVNRPCQPRLALKDLTTVDYTVAYGTPGVDVGLSKDHTQAVTAVFADGSSGHKAWMGARFPNLTQGLTPTFPLGVGGTFVAGDGQGGFAPFAGYLRRGQYGSIASDDSYVSADVGNVEQFQQRAGVTVDGIVGAQTWEAAFQPGMGQGSVQGAYVGTIWERPSTVRYKTNAQGAETGDNPDFDPTVPRIEQYVPMGNHTDKNLGRQAAQQIVQLANPAPLTGTVTLTVDPEECSRFNMESGRNIKIKYFRGDDVTLRIVQRDRDWQAGSVTLTVDEAGRDRLTVQAIHQRDRDVADLVRRQKFGRNRGNVFNDYGQWLEEDGAGEIPLMFQQGGLWNVQQIPAAPQGTIVQVALAIGTGLNEDLLAQVVADKRPDIPGPGHGCMAIFAKPITANDLVAMDGMSTPGNALDSGDNPWDHNHKNLHQNFGMIYAAGGPDGQIGFYPKTDPQDGTGVTGLHYDGGPIQFGPTGYYYLWLAIWTPMSTKVGGKLFPGAPQ